MARNPQWYGSGANVYINYEVDSYKAKVSSNDTTPDFLDSKIVAGTNITINVVDEGGNETLQIAAADQALVDSYQSKVSVTDTSPDFLDSKITSEGLISITKLNDGGDEELSFSIDLDAYATDADLALKADLSLLDSYATNSDLADKADLSLLDSYAVLTDFNDHSARHESGGADAIKLDDLAEPDDTTDLDASTTKHGLLPKLPNNANEFLNGQGNWAVPAGGGGSGDDSYKAMISGDDSTPNYLEDKIVGDGLVSISTLNEAGDEDLQISVDLDGYAAAADLALKADLSLLDSYAVLTDFNDHSARHESGGADAIKLDDLASPDDNTDLNATTSSHGLLKKLDNDPSHFLNGVGNWATPPDTGISFTDIDGYATKDWVADGYLSLAGGTINGDVTLGDNELTIGKLRGDGGNIGVGNHSLINLSLSGVNDLSMDGDIDCNENNITAVGTVDGYDLESQFQNISNNFGLKADKSTLDAYQVVGAYITFTDIDGYAEKALLDSYATNSDLADKADLSLLDSYAVLTDFNDHSARHENGGADEISVAGLSGELADAQPPKTHSSSHENGGGDEISVAGLSGELADDQPPKTHDLGGAKHNADTLANLNSKVSDATLIDATLLDSYAVLTDFNDHSARHESGGADAIKLDDLASPDDNTDLNVSTSAHGLCPKLDNNATHFLNGQGGWTAAGGGGITYGDIDDYATMDWVADSYASLTEKVYASGSSNRSVRSTTVTSANTWYNVNHESGFSTQYEGGMTVDNDGVFSFTKDGTYNIRVGMLGQSPGQNNGRWTVAWMRGDGTTVGSDGGGSVQFSKNFVGASAYTFHAMEFYQEIDSGQDGYLVVRRNSACTDTTFNMTQCYVSVEWVRPKA